MKNCLKNLEIAMFEPNVMMMSAITPMQLVKLMISQGYDINDIDIVPDNAGGNNDGKSEDVIVIENSKKIASH